MPQSTRKVILRRFSGDVLHGYLPATAFVRRQSPTGGAALGLLDLAGRTIPIPLADVRLISFVRDFNLDDPHNPERLARTAFLARPRSEGLWLRLTFPDGKQLEGLAPIDVTLLDALVEDHGLFLTPPDDRANTHRLYVPRTAIANLQLLAVITTPSQTRTSKPPISQSGDLFPDP